MTLPYWVALHSMAHSFIELDKAVVDMISLISFLWLWFSSVCPLMEKDRSLLKLPDGRDWLRGKLDLVLMGRAMLSKSLIQFSVDGFGCVPSLLFDLRPNCGGGNEANGTSCKGPMHVLLCGVTLTLQQAIADPRLCQVCTPGNSRASLGQSLLGSLPLSPLSWWTQVLFVPFNNLFPQFCVSSGECMVGLMATSSKKDYAYPDLLHQSPHPCGSPLLTHTSARNTQTQSWLSLCGVSGSWCAQGLFEPSECLWRLWVLILNVILPLLPSCWSSSFALRHGVCFLGGIQHSPVDGFSAVSCNFTVLTGEGEHTSFYSTISIAQ